MAALAAALVLCCAGPASAAPVASRSAVLGAGDVAGLTVGSAPASAWLNLVGSHAGSGGHASTTVVKSGGSPKLLIVSHALVARDGVHASAAKRALGAVSPARANGVDARALGVSAAALRKAQRIAWRDGPVVGQLVVVGAGKDDALVRRLQDVVRTRVRRTLDQSAWDALLARVAARGGRADASTAVQAFSLAVAPLPGVRVPKGPKGSIPEGTLAISWVLANYGRLTPGVRQAFDKAVRRAFGLSREVPAAGGQLNAVKDQAVAFVGDRAGVQVTIPISVVRGYPSTARGAAAMGVDAGGSYRSDKPAARCIISVRSAGVSKTVIAHEVFHCVQIQLTGRANGLGALDADRAWLGEGSASYAGCLFSQDGAAPYRKAYAAYVEQPLTPLGSRSYDAVGYFAHLDASGAGALSGVRQAIASSSLAAAAFPASGEGAPDILDAWASSLYRSPSLGAQWDVSGACVPPRSAAAQATPIVLTAGESVTLAAPAYAAHPYTLFASHSTSDAIRVHVASGRVRIGAAGVDARPTGDAVYCLGNAASGANPQVALTGGLTGAKVTMTAVDASVACGPGGSATCAAQLCLPFSGPSSTPQPPGPLSPVPQGNPIPAENAKPGTPISVWDIAPSSFPDGADNLQGFTDNISYDVGETARFKISSDVGYRMDIYRMGWYQGNGARLITSITGLPAATGQPACATDTTGQVQCPWSVRATWQIPADAVSGVYFAKLTGTDNAQSHVFFVVRNDASHADIYYQTSDTTWQAYNQFGGTSLYTGFPGTNPTRAYKVSYDRPFTTRGVSQGQDFVFNAEYPMIRWLERNGYDVSYETGVDTDRYGSLIKNHRMFMSTGHDEYWSGQQRANVEAARDAGTNLSFFSGNEVFWKTRWENDHRTLVCYKTTHNPGSPGAVDPTGVWTGSWRDPAAAAVQSGVRPENELTGQIFTVNSGTTSIQVPPQYHSLPIWRHTSVASASGTVSLGTDTLGYEWDSDKVSELPAAARPPSFTQPERMTELSSTTFGAPEVIQDMGHTYLPGTVTHNMTLYHAPSGAQVFGAGTVQWSWGLDPEHDRDAVPADPDMQQATVNLFADMGVAPATLQLALSPG